MSKKQGKLYYNEKLDRYELNGEELHCGEGLDVLLNDTWVSSRMEAKHIWTGDKSNLVWYLVGLDGLILDGRIARA